ncbi:hypothetical protein EJB05_40814, partial [Eragrostis curvula]
MANLRSVCGELVVTQGTYMLISQHEAVIVVSITVVVAGRDRIYDETRELAVVGGTGRLREAAGYVLWTTAKVLSDIHMVLELDVHATVPDNNPAVVSRAGHSSSSHSSLAMATATVSE